MTEELHLSASVDEDLEVLRGAGVLGEVSIFIDSPSREGSGCEAGTGNVSFANNVVFQGAAALGVPSRMPPSTQVLASRSTCVFEPSDPPDKLMSSLMAPAFLSHTSSSPNTPLKGDKRGHGAHEASLRPPRLPVRGGLHRDAAHLQLGIGHHRQTRARARRRRTYPVLVERPIAQRLLAIAVGPNQRIPSRAARTRRHRAWPGTTCLHPWTRLTTAQTTQATTRPISAASRPRIRGSSTCGRPASRPLIPAARTITNPWSFAAHSCCSRSCSGWRP